MSADHSHTSSPDAAANCLFCKIASGRIPSRKVFEDEHILAFHDINPWAPVHFLMIPKAHINSMAQVGPEHEALIGRMLADAARASDTPGTPPELSAAATSAASSRRRSSAKPLSRR